MKQNYIQFSKEILKILKQSKNLLAFSGGIDSSALFFLLQEQNINFDLAIVDYGVRKESKDEIHYAKTLATKYKKQCHILESKPIKSQFELNARKIRYSFFNSLILSHNYESLITAHHFDDRLEWFFMQLANGSGLNTLLGFKEYERRVVKKRQYYLLRPLIMSTKKELLAYNQDNNIMYFLDKSNEDSKFLRNFFRHTITTPLSEHFSNGLKKSFLFLSKEQTLLYPDVIICTDYNLFSFQSYFNEIHTVDLLAKRLGYVMSSAQKQELYCTLQKQSSCVIGGKIVIAKSEGIVFVGICITWLLNALFDNAKDKTDELMYLLLPNMDRLQNFFIHNIGGPKIYKNTITSTKNHDSKTHQDKHSIQASTKDSKRQISSNQSSHDIPMLFIPKKQRELYRLEKIPAKIRPILYFNSLDIWDEK